MTTASPLTDRTWPVPNRHPLMRMRWHDLLFMHWSFSPDVIARLLPRGIGLDTFQDRAWVGVVPFRMTDVAPRLVPALPWFSAFPELNVRTYVTINGKPGVWFFSLDATNPIAVRVARFAFHLKYMDARISVDEDGDWIRYRHRRTHHGEPAAHVEMSYRPVGDSFLAKVGSLEHWLTARYCLYVVNRQGKVLRGEIDHRPWLLQWAEAAIDSCTMIESLGISPPTEQPHLLFARDILAQAWANDPVLL